MIRSILREGSPFAIQFFLRFTPSRVEKIFSDRRFFFVVGMGRSGTMFLANLLDQATGCSVYHEYFRDRSALVDAYWHPDKARMYISGLRKCLIAARITVAHESIYGEVNSYLRNHVDALQQASWSPKILHIVRDGRDVVRSLMNRASFTISDRKHTGRLAPRSGDPLAEEWPSMDRFAKVCWYWADTNRNLLLRDLPLIRFEDIIESYENLATQVLEPLDIELSFENWRNAVSSPKNISQNVDFPNWSNWTRIQKRQFERFCGSLMADIGYF